MLFLRIGAVVTLLSSVLASGHGAMKHLKRAEELRSRQIERQRKILPRQDPQPPKYQFLTDKSQRFLVDGANLPEIDFDVGESYAGLLPISSDPKETRKLFFWFFPSTNPAARGQITLWFNGGPGCSSLAGLLSENGPVLWMDGTAGPVPNSYSWTNLTNMLWIEQPVGVGYTQGTPNITNEVELGKQFLGFYKQFVDTFDIRGYETYLTGESYAGYYVPYIADAFIQAHDLSYYNLKGISVNDPIIGDDTLHFQVAAVPFVEYWQNLFYFNETFMKQIKDRANECSYTSYNEKNFKFPPPPGPLPLLPNPYHNQNYTCDMFDTIYFGALRTNPCFNVYHITDTCPHLSSVFGQVNVGDYVQPGAQNYFNRSDVQAALHAKIGTDWHVCTRKNVFNYGYENNYTLYDSSLGPALDGTLQRVIEYTNNTIIGVGNLDYLLPPNGTIFTMQNMSWNGLQGWQQYPQQNNFYVPYHPEYNGGRMSEAGYVGKWGEERGVTFYTVQLAGHTLPGYSAGSSYRVLEKLLGRISNLSEVSDFTTQQGNFTGRGTIYKRLANFGISRPIQ